MTRDRWLWLSLIAFLALSWITTGIGLRLFLPLPVAFLLSLAITIMMGVLAPRLVPHWRRKGRWLLSATTYAMLACVSILFAASFYFQRISGESLEQARVTEAEHKLLAAVGGLRDYYNELATRMARLSEYSAGQARIESARGGTCAGSAGRGQGPFWRKRHWQAEYFADVAADVGARADRLDKTLAQIEAIVADPALTGLEKQKALQRLQPLLGPQLDSRKVEPILSELAAQARYETTGFPADPRYAYRGRRFDGRPCGDNRLVERIRAVLALGRPPEPDLSFELYSARDLRFSIDAVLGLVRQLLAFGKAGDMTGDQAFALGFGLFQDAIILAVGFIIGLGRRERPALRLTEQDAKRLNRRLQTIHRQYHDALGLDAPPADSVPPHPLQALLDAVSVPAGADKVILLPEHFRRHAGDSGPLAVAPRAERRLEAAIEVCHALHDAGLLGEPRRPWWRNRVTEYGGHDCTTVAQHYGLPSGSVTAFSVFLTDPALMLDATQILTGEPMPALPPHLHLQRALLAFQHPAWFGAAAPRQPAANDATLLLERTRLLPSGGDNAPVAEVVLYPQIFERDRRLMRLLKDDDHGLDADLSEEQASERHWLARLLFPRHRFLLGPRSHAALKRLVTTAEGG